MPIFRALLGAPLLSVALLLSLGACTAPPPAGPAAAATATVVVDWRYERTQNFEPSRPGLGRAHRWNSPLGWADVFVYDLRRSNWAPGVGDPQFEAHFRSTVNEVRELAAAGVYRQLQVGPVRDVQIGGETFRVISFDYTLQAGNRPVSSWTYLTARQGRLLKYRMSFDRVPGGPDLEAVTRRFIETNLRTGPDTPPSPAARPV